MSQLLSHIQFQGTLLIFGILLVFSIVLSVIIFMFANIWLTNHVLLVHQHVYRHLSSHVMPLCFVYCKAWNKMKWYLAGANACDKSYTVYIMQSLKAMSVSIWVYSHTKVAMCYWVYIIHTSYCTRQNPYKLVWQG